MVEDALTVFLAEEKDLPNNVYPAYDTELHLMARLQYWIYKECGWNFHYHYSQAHDKLSVIEYIIVSSLS